MATRELDRRSDSMSPSVDENTVKVVTVLPVPVILSDKQPYLCQHLKMISSPVYITVMLFAMSTWIAIVGVWVEMPLLVNALPESWSLPSYLVIIIQCANLGPAIYAIYIKLRPKHTGHDKVNTLCIDMEVGMSLLLIVIAIISVLLLSAFWEAVTQIGTGNHSTALLILVSFAAFSSCTSSVVFLPYMARFPSVYISAYYFGLGLCGLIPGIAGLIQGAGQEPICHNTTDFANETVPLNSTSVSLEKYLVEYPAPRFSVSAFFVFISALLCVSCVAFCCLSFMPTCRKEKVTAPSADSAHKQSSSETSAAEFKTVLDEETLEARKLLNPSPIASEDHSIGDKVVNHSFDYKRPNIKQYRFVSLLTIIGVVSALWNGVLPATQSYTCLPYGSVVYTLSICLSWIMSPIATLPNMIAPTSSLPLVGGLTIGASVLSAYHLVLAGQSPHPVLQYHISGQIIVVVTAVVIAFSFSFIRVSVASILRREGGRSELLWCGGITQFGSFCGAVISFLLVSIFRVFERLPPCSS